MNSCAGSAVAEVFDGTEVVVVAQHSRKGGIETTFVTVAGIFSTRILIVTVQRCASASTVEAAVVVSTEVEVVARNVIDDSVTIVVIAVADLYFRFHCGAAGPILGITFPASAADSEFIIELAGGPVFASYEI